MTISRLRTLSSTAVLAGLALLLSACGPSADEEAGQESAANAGANEAVPAAVSPPAGEGIACNRDCLAEATEAYVAAIVAHDPSQAPLAEDIVFVENIQMMEPGQGLWQSVVEGPDNFAIAVPDEMNQAVGYLAMMTRMAPPQAPQGASPEEQADFARENPEPVEQPVIVAFRLKFNDRGEISEAEHLLAGVREPQMGNLQTPRSGLLSEVPAGQRLSHAELIDIGASYYDALDDNDGELTPFAQDCERHENGMITASPEPADAPAIPGTEATPRTARDCAGQLTSGTFQYIDRIENRRVFAADPQTGLVMGLSHFRHPMDNLPYSVTNLDGSTAERTADNMPFAPFDLPAAHIFKVGADGQVHEIEAMGFTTAYDSPTGWE